MTDEERDKLIEKLHEFDPSDNYHEQDHFPEDDNELDFARGYYAAINRVIALLRGEIEDWASPRRCESCKQPLPKNDDDKPKLKKLLKRPDVFAGNDTDDCTRGEDRASRVTYVGWEGSALQCRFKHNGLRCTSGGSLVKEHEHMNLRYSKYFADGHWQDIP